MWSRDMDNQECPCPSCGFYTTGGVSFGSYNICPLCGWEDDPVQMANPALRGGANGGSLIEYQREALEVYPTEMQVYDSYERDPKWWPLNEAEIELAESEKHKNKAAYEYADAYWVTKR